MASNDDTMRHVGYEETNSCIEQYFSKNTVQIISNKVTQLLEGISKRPIIVTDRVIEHVLSQVKEGYRPPTGCIYSRYTIPSGGNSDSLVQNMIDQSIEIIISNVKNDLETEKNNKQLSVWNSVYGDFNKHQLLQHPPIKTQVKRPSSFQFNMMY